MNKLANQPGDQLGDQFPPSSTENENGLALTQTVWQQDGVG